MLVKIDKPITFNISNPIDLKIPKITKEKIKNCWNEFIKDKNDYWDGDIFIASKMDIDNNIVEISKTKFSSLIYSKFTDELEIRQLFAGILFKTKDNKYVVIRNNHNIINIIGGLVDYDDFKENTLIPDLCIKREVLEEVGIDLDDKTKVIDYKIKYIKVPTNNEKYCSIGLLYTGTLNYTSEEFKEYMNSNIFDNEIKECYFLSKEECLNLNIDEKSDISYLKEFVSLEN